MPSDRSLFIAEISGRLLVHEMVRRLTRRLAPPAAGIERFDWEAVRVDRGMALPHDFRDFMDTFGPGTIDNVLGIAAPALRAGEARGLVVGAVASETAYRTFHGEVRCPAWPAEGSLLRWGVTPVGYDLFWRVQGASPDDWPVVVVGYRNGTAFELPYGMAEFIYCMLGDRLNRPADIPDLAGHPHSRFIGKQEEDTLSAAGADPWEYLDEHWEGQAEERTRSGPRTWIEGPGRHDSSNPPLPRLTIRAFGVDGECLRMNVTLDPGTATEAELRLDQPLLASVRIGGPQGDVLHRQGLVASAPDRDASGPVVASAATPVELSVKVDEELDATAISWPDLMRAMSQEDEWSISVWIEDPAIGTLRADHGIVWA